MEDPSGRGKLRTQPVRDAPGGQRDSSIMRRLFLEFLGYGVVSVAALAVDIAVLRALVEVVGWHYLPASAIAFITGAAVAYLLSIRFVFRSQHSSSRTLEFSYFLGLGVLGLLVNAAVLSVAISGVGLGLVTAKLVAALCTFTTNFLSRRALLFSPSRSSE
jgi:putative flippase GtrA